MKVGKNGNGKFGSFGCIRNTTARCDSLICIMLSVLISSETELTRLCATVSFTSAVAFDICDIVQLTFF